MNFPSEASAAEPLGLCRSTDDYFVSQFEREFWVQHGHEAEPETIRGMSGGPVLAIRRGAETDIMTYEFVGHIYAFSEDYELLYVRLARVFAL